MKKAPDFSEALILLGRDGEIRTHDPLHPMQVRYRAALHPDFLIGFFLKEIILIPVFLVHGNGSPFWGLQKYHLLTNLANGNWYMVFGSWYRVLGFGLRASGVRFQTTDHVPGTKDHIPGTEDFGLQTTDYGLKANISSNSS